MKNILKKSGLEAKLSDYYIERTEKMQVQLTAQILNAKS
jgi:hypothetical protein